MTTYNISCIVYGEYPLSISLTIDENTKLSDLLSSLLLYFINSPQPKFPTDARFNGFPLFRKDKDLLNKTIQALAAEYNESIRNGLIINFYYYPEFATGKSLYDLLFAEKTGQNLQPLPTDKITAAPALMYQGELSDAKVAALTSENLSKLINAGKKKELEHFLRHHHKTNPAKLKKIMNAPYCRSLPIFKAVRRSHIDIMRLLMKFDADINPIAKQITNKKGRPVIKTTTLAIAVMMDNHAKLTLLLDSNPHPNTVAHALAKIPAKYRSRPLFKILQEHSEKKPVATSAPRETIAIPEPVRTLPSDAKTQKRKASLELKESGNKKNKPEPVKLSGSAFSVFGQNAAQAQQRLAALRQQALAAKSTVPIQH